jgi:hypothetical protein
MLLQRPIVRPHRAYQAKPQRAEAFPAAHCAVLAIASDHERLTADLYWKRPSLGTGLFWY